MFDGKRCRACEKRGLEGNEGQRNRIHDAELAVVRRSLELGVSLREFRAMQMALDILKGIRKNEEPDWGG